MIWLKFYIIGVIITLFILTIGDGVTDRDNNNFREIVTYTILWPFWWVYVTINSIIECFVR